MSIGAGTDNRAVTYLGPRGSFAEAAVLKWPGSSGAELLPATSVPAALEAVRDDVVDYALVPIENSVEGSVSATLDELGSGQRLVIVDEVVLPVQFSLLTLETLLTATLDKRADIKFAIETKHPVRYGGYVERELADVLARYGLDRPRPDGVPPARMMSFSRTAVLRMHRLAPAVPTVFLMDRIWWPYRDGSLPPGVFAAGPSIEVLRAHPGYVGRVHAAGGQVHVWTVDEKEDLQLCVEQGVDVVISNRPGKVLGWLDR